MSRLKRFFARLRLSLRTSRAERELAREIQAHLQLLEDKYVAQGMSREDARCAAKRAFHGVEQTKELQRDARSFRWLAGWPMDLKLGARMLVKSPGLSVIAVIALAVAIGAGAAYMEFVNDFFNPRLAFPGGDRLVGIFNHDLTKNDVDQRSLHDFAQWKTQLTTVEELGASRQIELNLKTDDGRIEPARGVEISASAFRVVQVAPLHGRPLLDHDQTPGATPVLVIGEDLWRTRFNADPAVVGRTVSFGETSYTLVGVMPKGFGFPISSSLWKPMRLNAAAFRRGEGPQIRIFGRLREGATVGEAQAELDTLRAGAEAATPELKLRPTVKPYVDSIFGTPNMIWQVRVFYTLNIFFLGLLGICAANVATLVFARTATREGEITVRTALGASRGRIVAQLIAEALVFTSIAAVAGLLGARFVLRKVREVVVAAQTTPVPFWWDDGMAIETIAYAAVLVVLSALIIGGVPAWKATGPQMQARLKEAGPGGGSMRFGRLWTGVVVAQIAVTVMFLAAVASLGWNGYTMSRQFMDVSVPRHEYLVAGLRLPGMDTASAEHTQRWTAVLREFQRRLNDDPGIINAAYSVRVPGGNPEEFRLEFADPSLHAEAHAKKSGDVLWVKSARVGSNYFETMNQQLVAGRTFTEGEVESGRNVAVVDETFVRTLLGGRNPIGLLVRQPAGVNGNPPGAWFEIVGVVRDISRASDVKTTEHAWLYRPRELGGNAMARVIVHARTPDAAARLRAAAVATDPELRLADLMTLERLAELEVQTMGYFAAGTAIVASVALLLSTAGIYALISFTLSRRTREIGIRTALGAAPRRIVTGILSRAMIQIGIGVALGIIPATVMLSRGLEDSSKMNGWMTLGVGAGIVLFVITIAAISCIPPLRRALRIQPTEALRTT